MDWYQIQAFIFRWQANKDSQLEFEQRGSFTTTQLRTRLVWRIPSAPFASFAQHKSEPIFRTHQMWETRDDVKIICNINAPSIAPHVKTSRCLTGISLFLRRRCWHDLVQHNKSLMKNIFRINNNDNNSSSVSDSMSHLRFYSSLALFFRVMKNVLLCIVWAVAKWRIPAVHCGICGDMENGKLRAIIFSVARIETR